MWGRKQGHKGAPHSPPQISQKQTFPIWLFCWEPLKGIGTLSSIYETRLWAQCLCLGGGAMPAWGQAAGYSLTSACRSWVPSCSCSSCSVAWPTATGRRCYTETSSHRTYSSMSEESSSWLTSVPLASPFIPVIPQPYSPSPSFPLTTSSQSLPFSLSRLHLGSPQSQLHSPPDGP